MKTLAQSFVVALLASAVGTLHGATPWAVWTDFTGLTSDNTLAPQAAFTANDISAAGWTLTLNGGSVNEDGTLQTGTGTPPAITFDSSIDIGYGANPLTIVLTVRDMGSTTGVPIVHAGIYTYNGSSYTVGVGLSAMADGAASIKGIWANTFWTDSSNTAADFDALAGSDSVTFATSFSSSGTIVSQISSSEVSTIATWAKLMAKNFTVPGIHFGNAVNASSGGLDYTIERIAVFRGTPTNAELQALLSNQVLCTEDVTCTLLSSGVTLVASGGMIDLSSVTLSNSVSLQLDCTAYTPVTKVTPFTLPEGWSGTVTLSGDFADGYTWDATTYTLWNDDWTPLPWQLTWMPMGDSITEGEQYMGHEGSGTVATRGGYRYQLWKALEAGGQDVRSVGYRTGHSGTDEVTDNPDWAWHAALYGGIIKAIESRGAQWFNVETALENADYPDIISLMIGINDLSYLSTNRTADVTDGIQDVFEAWTELVEKLATCRPKSKIVVSTVLPVVSSNVTGLRYTPFNELIRTAATNKAAPFDHSNVIFVDVCKLAFNDTYNGDYFKSDGVHPNETGSKMVAEAFLTGFAEAIRTIQSESLAIAQVHNGTSGQVTVRLTKALSEVSGATLAISGTDVTGTSVELTLSDGTVDASDAHLIHFTTDNAFFGGSYTVTLGGTATVQDATETTDLSTLTASGSTVELQGSGAAQNVEASFLKGFVKLSTLDIGDNDNFGSTGPSSDVLTTEAVADGAIRRVGYYLELKRADKPPQFVWVSMSAEAFGYDKDMVGLPTAATGTHKAVVENLSVFGNRGNFEKNVTGGTGIIEFTPYTWEATDESTGKTEAYSGLFGWNDTLAPNTGYYGCMQVARVRDGAAGTWQDPAAELLFAYNIFNSSTASDVAIGSFSVHWTNAGGGTMISPVYDWTHFTRYAGYTQYAPSIYEVKTLEVWVDPAPGYLLRLK